MQKKKTTLEEVESVIVHMDFRPDDQLVDRPARIIVEQADLKVSQDPAVALCTSPLGAGLGVAVYDPDARVGGLLNCMLPTSSLDARRAALHPGMFLDTGWTALLKAVQRLRANPGNLRVFVAGAAEILDDTTLFNLGRINQEYLREYLRQSGVELNADNMGGRTNCSMELAVATGEVRLRYSGQLISKFLCKP